MQQVSLGYDSKNFSVLVIALDTIFFYFDILVSLFDTLHMQQVTLGYVAKN